MIRCLENGRKGAAGVPRNGRGPLAGTRVGFYTSVVGMGGSEVLVADAMEGAYRAGAEVICWSEPNAAIRSLIAARAGRLQVTHYDWPRGRSEVQEEATAAPEHPTPPRGRGGRAAVKALTPFAIKRWIGFRRTAREFGSELHRVAPDILFVNVNGSEAVSLAGSACGVPVVNCYHLSYTQSPGGLLSRLGDWRARRATMKAGTLTVHTSLAVRDQWCRAFSHPTSTTRVIYNGVDAVNIPDRVATRTALGLSDREFAFCVPGRLDPIKGHVHLIEAVRRIRERFSPGRVLVCGDGSLRPELEQAVARARLTDVITFLGWRSDLPAVVGAADCVVLPSVASENLSVAVLEALSAGTPAIVTQIGGMSEAVKDGKTGMVVPPADADRLGEALLRMMSDRAAARAMGAAAREDARTRFTRERMMNEYVAVFLEALQRKDRVGVT